MSSSQAGSPGSQKENAGVVPHAAQKEPTAASAAVLSQGSQNASVEDKPSSVRPLGVITNAYPHKDQEDKSIAAEERSVMSKDHSSSNNVVYEDVDSTTSKSSREPIDTANVSFGIARPTTQKRGNLGFSSTDNDSAEGVVESSITGSEEDISNMLLFPQKQASSSFSFIAPGVPSPPASPPHFDQTSPGRVDSPSFHHPPLNISSDLPPGYPSDLHAVCAKVNPSAERLRATLLVAQGTPAVKTVDANGRLALHLLGNNEYLITNFLRQAKTTNYARFNGLPPTELDDFVLDLVKAYPKGCITTDADGLVPFSKCIRDWVTLASKGMLPMDHRDIENDDIILQQSIGPHDEGASSQAVEGMERVIEDASAERQSHSRQRQNDDETLGNRSVWTNLTNLTLPTAFRSVYSTTGGKRSRQFGGTGTRALYRSGNESFSSFEDEGMLSSDNLASNTRNNRSASHSPVSPDGSRENVFFGRDDRSLGSFSSAPDGASFDDIFPENIPVPPVVEWNLKMLSAIVEHFESRADDVCESDEDGTVLGTWQAQQRTRENQGTPGADAQAFQTAANNAEWIAKTIVSAISSIPSFMKTLLLLEDSDPAKQRLFNLTIVKRMIYDPHTIGNWLVYMLEAIDSDVADRGVQFIEMLSSNPETADFYGGTTVKGFPNKGVPTSLQRLRLYKKVARLDYLLPAVLALEDVSMVDRVAKTHLMRHVQDRELMQNQTLLMAAFDLFFHIMLLVAFTVSTNYYLAGGDYNTQYLVTFYMSLVCLIFRVGWKLAQMASMIKISRSAFLFNNFRVGDLFIDWLTVGMVLGGLVWMEVTVNKTEGQIVSDQYIRGYLAVTVGMLWVNVVRWFYIVNWSVTSFIDMLRQVVFDMRVFFFILTVTVLAFANMFYIILFNEDGSCNDDGFCDKKHVYLEVYQIVLGQFDLEDFSTTFSVVLFVIFTVFVLLVLLFVVIAVVVEAHTKFTVARNSTARPEHGSRARLVYVAQLRAFRRMIEGEWTVMQYVAAVLFVASVGLIAVLFLREIRQHFHDFYGGLLIILIFAALVVFLLFGILAFVSHMTYFDLTETSRSHRTFWGRIMGCCGLWRCLFWPLRALMLMIIGVSRDEENVNRKSKDDKKKASPMPRKMDPEEIAGSWGGAASHIHSDVKRMVEASQVQTKMHLIEELAAMEGRMRQVSDKSKSHLLMELNASQQQLEKMVGKLQSVLNGALREPEDEKVASNEKPPPPPPPKDVDVKPTPAEMSQQASMERSARIQRYSARPHSERAHTVVETPPELNIAPDNENESVCQSTMVQEWSVDGMESYQVYE